MRKTIIILVLIFAYILKIEVKAENINPSDIEKYLNIYDLTNVEKVTKNQTGLNFKETVVKVIKGELNISPQNIIKDILKSLFNELYANSYLIKNLLIVAIFSSILKNLTDSFNRKEVGELGFYISYIVLIIILFNSFTIAISIMNELVLSISEVMESVLPLIMSLLYVSGYAASAFVFNPLLFFAVNIITFLTKNLVSPIITFAAIIQIINYLSIKEVFSKLTEQIRGGISFAIKTIGLIFIAILSLQRVSTPIVNNLITRTAKVSINAIPVVGEVLSGSVDTVLFWLQASRSGFLIAILITVITISFIPIIKLVILIFIYKITASLMEPICDERIIECIDGIGSLTITILGVTFLSTVMFIFYVMITLSF